ncbi:Lnb N-terminal periplasmic domain-containing protein [Runella aurantiaca]|uniref:DUF4105 domain-containing protein n=1 Tax=Runella aurantiaca TaxID=2282308 RepID=A0A369I7Q5_9BACT|nr:DUF4105 domain-containing protein [Runella aurantiaca]RDB03184.1 DUF4105 domain-containing protein [Runella aurantiaca]
MSQKVRLILGIFLFMSRVAFPQLTANSSISLITVGPGEEVFTAFGHSALRISDPDLGIDNIYNYGTFSFNEGFYLRFTKGELNFWLSTAPFHRAFYSWTVYENRTVTQQVLNLNQNQKNALFGFLENNLEPQNSVYRYDYFYDNCSNRIDTALKKVLGVNIKFSPESIAKKHNTTDASIRQLTHGYLLHNPWGELGIETCLGIDMDKKITAEQFKFLPDYLMWNYDEAKIRPNGAWEPLVKEKVVLFQALNKTSPPNPFSPKAIFSFVLVLSCLLSLPTLHKTFFARLFDFTLFLTSGAVGLLILFLWFFTTHHSQINLNILWANPFNLVVSFLLFSKKRGPILLKISLVNGLLLVLVLAFWTILPQRLNNAYLLVCITLLIRHSANYWFLKAASSKIKTAPSIKGL